MCVCVCVCVSGVVAYSHLHTGLKDMNFGVKLQHVLGRMTFKVTKTYLSLIIDFTITLDLRLIFH
jgi:hypothetical protein